MAGIPTIVWRVCCFVALPLLLAGCGGSGSGGSSDTKKSTTVLMMRHCIRSIPEKGVYGNDKYLYFNNFSAQEWAPFNEPDFFCLPLGEEVVEQSGQWYKDHGNLPLPLSVKADTCERDNVTARRLVKGLGLTADQYTFKSTHLPFSDGEESKDCQVPTRAEIGAAIEKQMKAYPQPESFAKMKQELVDIVGLGAAQDWTNWPCGVAADAAAHPWAPVNGSCNVAGELAERFLMEWGGGMTPGFGKVKIEDIPRFLELHSWYLTVVSFIPELAKFSAASIAWDILEFLEAGSQGTRAFVGHDTQQGLLNAALGFSWDPSPFPKNATLPGSALRFDREEGSDTVKVSYVYVENFSNGGAMKSVPAKFPGFDEGTVSLKGLRKLIESGTTKACRSSQRLEAERSTVV